jgi:DNA-binding LacI/PurR family transcriptional regulator
LVHDPFLYERVYSYVLHQIRTEQLGPGDRVPSEKELAEQFGVSRITSKRALRMLADAGIVDRRRGQGSFVTRDARRLESIRQTPDRRYERSQRTGCLALVLPDATEVYGLELFCAIEERCAELGYHLVIRRTKDSQQVEEQAIESLVGGGVVDGLIVFPVHGEFYNASLVRLVLDHSPLVLVDRYLPGLPACSVCTDNLGAARALTSYILDKGHDQIAFLSPPAENTTSIEERMQGYREVLRERGYPREAERCFTEFRSTLPSARSRETDTDKQALGEFLQSASKVTGFVACEYNIAVLLVEVLREAGTWDPNRYLITCFDSPGPQRGGCPFVYIKQDEREMGRRAVDLLIAQLSGDEVPHRSILPFTLIEPPQKMTTFGA